MSATIPLGGGPAPKDLSVGQLVADSKVIEAEIPAVADKAQAFLLGFADEIAQAFPGTQLAAKTKQLAIAAGLVEKEVLADDLAAEKVTKGLGIPLAILGGVKVAGSGQLVQSIEHVASTVIEAKDGVQSSMTKHQKLLSEVIAILQFLCIGGGLVLQLWPQVGGQSLGGGVTFAVLLSAIRNYLMPKLAQYADAAPRATLVVTKP